MGVYENISLFVVKILFNLAESIAVKQEGCNEEKAVSNKGNAFYDCFGTRKA
ncbi:hypothetical protein D3C86_2215630 [compost metagenome]